jgi:spermidine synthase
MSMRVEKEEFYHDTKYGEIVFGQGNGGMGTLTIDRGLQFYEADEHRYHQTVFALPSYFVEKEEQRVLVLGGGDGLGVRELLKLNHVKSIDLVDISEAMIYLATKVDGMTKMNKNSLSDERVTVYIQDSNEFIPNAIKNEEKWDLIILDYPDPLNDKEYGVNSLFTAEHYRTIKQILAPEGVISLQATAAYYTPNVLEKVYIETRKVFSSALKAVVNIQSFGDIACIFARDTEKDSNTWKPCRKFHDGLFYDESSVNRFFYMFKDERNTIPSPYLDKMDLADIIAHDFDGEFRRTELNYFVNRGREGNIGTLPFQLGAAINPQEVVDLHENMKNKKFYSVKEIFKEYNLVLGYPGFNYDELDDEDVFFAGTRTITEPDGEIRGMIRFRENEDEIENEYVFIKDERAFARMVHEYPREFKRTEGRKPISISYWDHNIYVRGIIEKLGGTTSETGFTWMESSNKELVKSRPVNSFSLDLGDAGEINYNGLIAFWETDWKKTSNKVSQVKEMMKDKGVPYLAIFSSTVPDDRSYFGFTVGQIARGMPEVDKICERSERKGVI